VKRALASVPDAPPRALGAIRVSKERDGMVSPDVQRVAISDYCAARGYQIDGWIEGLDESGSRARSAWWPRLDQAVAAVEAGEYDVIVVWKFSRTARHRLRWAVALDRVGSAGGRLESATEQIDVSTSAGRFTRGMFGEMAAFEAERIGEGWKEAHAKRIRDGKPANGKPRWGYTYDPERKLHVPDPETGPVLADMYRRYVAGESVYQLVRWLNAHGWRTTLGGIWSDRSLRRVLDSGFASGRFMAAGQLHRGVHEALIDDSVWRAYLDARDSRRARPARAVRSQYLLSGLVRCGRCGGAMVAGQFGHARSPKYRCKAGKESGPEVCTGGYVMASMLEREVLDWLRELADEAEVARYAHAAADRQRARAVSEEDRLAREIGRVEESLTRLAVQHAEAPLPAEVYRRARERLDVQLEELSQALDAAARESRAATADPAAAARGLLETWDRRPVEHRREGLRQLLAEVRVWSGRPRARIVLRPVWEA
jgi:DNA invertase Pin-like site-specific DNA recombinase